LCWSGFRTLDAHAVLSKAPVLRIFTPIFLVQFKIIQPP
jgi:hypothetical protein